MSAFDDPDKLSFTEAELQAFLAGDVASEDEPNEGDDSLPEVIERLVDAEREAVALWQRDITHPFPERVRGIDIVEAEVAGYAVRYIPDVQSNLFQLPPKLKAGFKDDCAEGGWYLIPEQPIGGQDVELLLEQFLDVNPELAQELLELRAANPNQRLVADYYYAAKIMNKLFPDLAESRVRLPTPLEQWYLTDTAEAGPTEGEFLCVSKKDKLVPMISVVFREEELSAYRLYGLADSYQGALFPMRKLN